MAEETKVRRYTDEDTLDVLSRHFSLSKAQLWPDYVGMRYFDGESSIATLGGMSKTEFMDVLPYVITHPNAFRFEEGGRLAPHQLFSLSREKGITQSDLRHHYSSFEMKLLGPETSFITAAIIADIDHVEEKDLGFMSEYACQDVEDNYRRCVVRWSQNKSVLDVINSGKGSPIQLEQILDFSVAPAAVRFDEHGKLYVFECGGALREFTLGETKYIQTNVWNLRLDSPFDFGRLTLDGCPVTCPQIALYEGGMYLCTGHTGFSRYELQSHDPSVIQKSIASTPDMLIHDIVARDGNLLLSTTDYRHEVHTIFVVNPSATSLSQPVSSDSYATSLIRFGPQLRSLQAVYEGPAPRGFAVRMGWDHTVRMDIHNGDIFFPYGNGIGLYQGKGDGWSVAEMTHGLSNEPGSVLTPMTKFAIGDDFIVGQVMVKGVNGVPILALFREQFDATESSLVLRNGGMVSPSHFDLEHACYVPHITGETQMSASISAYGNRFAITNSTFNKVYIYSVASNGSVVDGESMGGRTE